MAPNTNIKSYLQQQHAIAAAAAAAAANAVALSASSSSYQSKQQFSEKHKRPQQQTSRATGSPLTMPMSPPLEVTRCYDEIDQIYDYIRGLAPLPDNLRAMKSIDFEKIEQRERLKRQQQQQQQQQQQLLHQEQKNAVAAAAADQFLQLDYQNGSASRKVARLRQREVAGLASGQARPSDAEQRPFSGGGSSPPQMSRRTTSHDAQQAANKRQQQQPKLIVPMPIRVTTTTSESRRPTIKRVESLNLQDCNRLAAQQHRTQAASSQWRQAKLQQQQQQQQPQLQQHLTTTSSQKHQEQVHQVPGASSKPNYLISATKRGQQFRLPRAQSTSTLDKQRIVQSTPSCDDGATDPTKSKLEKNAHEQQPQLTSIVCSDLVESFVDDDDDDDDGEDDDDGGENDRYERRAGSGSSDDKHTRTDRSKAIAGSEISHSSSSDSESNGEKRKSASPMQSASNKIVSSSSTRPPCDSNNSKDKEEHIYEQIPAHVPSTEQHHLIARRSIAAAEVASAAASGVKSKASTLFDKRPQQQQQLHPAKIDYPVAYSANVAANARYQQQVAALFACQQRLTNQRRQQQHHHQHHHRQQVSLPVSQFTPPVLSLSRPTSIVRTARDSNNVAQQQPQTATMPRALVDVARHQRLSMGNLHVLPAGGAANTTATGLIGMPLASLYGKRASIATPVYQHSSTLDKLPIGRSSSSSRVNRLGARPPKLSPAELIARIQMPRAVSKRQVVASAAPAPHLSSSTPRDQHQHRKHNLGQLVAVNPASDDRRQSIACGAYVWQQPMRASVKNVPRLDKSRDKQQQQQLVIGSTAGPTTVASVAATNLSSNRANKRASIRRLTAIGIEQAFDLVRQRPIAASSNEAAAAARGYFEPRQLIEAPLIDAEDDDNDNVSSSSESRSSSSAASEHNSIADNQLLAARASAKRCLHSISDLHSFSSSSSTTAQSSDDSSGSSATTTSESESESSRSTEAGAKLSRKRAVPPVGQGKRVLANGRQPSQSGASSLSNECDDAGNFVSSRSFIKCYYGRNGADNDTDNEKDAELNEKLAVRAAAAATTTTTTTSVATNLGKQKSKSKRLGSKLFSNGERLLSLIGLDTIGSSKSGAGNGGKGDKSARLVFKEKGTAKQSLASPPSSSSSSSSSQQRAKLSSRRTSAPPTPLAINSMAASATIANNRRQLSSLGVNKNSAATAGQSLATKTPLDPIGGVPNGTRATTTTTTLDSASRRRASLATPGVVRPTSPQSPPPPRPRDANDSICHFEHPLVEIAKVFDRGEQAGSIDKVAQQAKVKRSKAKANRHASSSKNPAEQQEAGSSGTTNSTSSYEAAIKNSAARQSSAAFSNKESAIEQHHHYHKSQTGQSKRLSSVVGQAAAVAADSQLHSSSNHNNNHQITTPQSSTLIKVPKLSKQSHLLNRPLPKLPASSAGLGAGSGSGSSNGRQSLQLNNVPLQQQAVHGANSRANQRTYNGINLQHVASAIVDRYGTSRSEPSSGAHNRVANRYILSQQLVRAKPANLMATGGGGGGAMTKSKHSPSSGGGGGGGGAIQHQQASLVSTNLDLTAEPTRDTARTPELTTRQRQRVPTSSSSAGLKSPSATSNNQLSSLGTIHASPTVTTYTSSGISSTHLATNTSSSSSQRSKASASSNRALAPITLSSSSSSHKRATLGLNSLEGGPSSWQQQSSGDRSDDDDDEREDDVGDDIDMIDDRGNSISPDMMRFGCGEGESARRGHLKSFDERFSSKYADQHLASSNDSLLESINFSGTLTSSKKKRQQLPAVTNSKR